ncbi:MAG: hypothetical protein Hyperionvirus4_71 [Hyperionvirus sp.]|uniref:Uncharacterized protein n=1 Tax=Hyperionvirus sp. TaxID=2487770 RepID=A0A3G5A783_9VIRU|nr:MAG: hypothetical protein Hyperionvirus4_70 [Hyperionvirus sp.]AYV83106.1 MAG: hypothetical protein Hyperionvirus4_71 [Hyperionvirus sp.]
MRALNQFKKEPFGFMHCLQPYDLNACGEW